MGRTIGDCLRTTTEIPLSLSLSGSICVCFAGHDPNCSASEIPPAAGY